MNENRVPPSVHEWLGPWRCPCSRCSSRRAWGLLLAIVLVLGLLNGMLGK